MADACKWCYTITDWCNTGTDLTICFEFWLQGGSPDKTMGRLTFSDGSQSSNVEWEIDDASINCTDYIETVTDSSTNVSYGTDNKQRLRLVRCSHRPQWLELQD